MHKITTKTLIHNYFYYNLFSRDDQEDPQAFITFCSINPNFMSFVTNPCRISQNLAAAVILLQFCSHISAGNDAWKTKILQL